MGIQVEFNPDLTLRRFGARGKDETECLPKRIQEGEIYYFRKEGQRNYCLKRSIPLRERSGRNIISEPIAEVRIMYEKHYVSRGKVYTEGKYLVSKLLDHDYSKLNTKKR